jgi:sugar phosphate permease
MNEMFKGSDGLPSGRRIIGAVCFGAGIAAGFVGMFVEGDWTRFIPMAAFIAAGMFLWGLVTMQNVQDIIKTQKGQQ